MSCVILALLSEHPDAVSQRKSKWEIGDLKGYQSLTLEFRSIADHTRIDLPILQRTFRQIPEFEPLRYGRIERSDQSTGFICGLEIGMQSNEPALELQQLGRGCTHRCQQTESQRNETFQP